jgi:alpha-tubulin suppressor-like RCC1 family protein
MVLPCANIHTLSVYLKELDGKKIVQIASGQQHSLALDSTGWVFAHLCTSLPICVHVHIFNRLVYVWGYNGYCRLGLGNQVDALKPKVVPQFAGPNEATMASAIAAGPTNSVVVDKQGMYWMAGKWKNSGEGTFLSHLSTSRNQGLCKSRFIRVTVLHFPIHAGYHVCRPLRSRILLFLPKSSC